MAKGIRELRRRIRGVKNIAQITRAMEMVASTKLKRLQERAEGGKPYAEALAGIVGRLAGRFSPQEYPLLQRGTAPRVGVLVVSADKGLCGAYNSNVFRMALAFRREQEAQGREVDYFVFGARGRGFFGRLEKGPTESYADPMEKIPFVRVRDVVRRVARRFLRGEISELHLLSTRFVSQAVHVAELRPLLPIEPAKLAGAGAAPAGDPILEPSAERIFARLLPKYVEIQVWGAVLESLASEFAMRRIAMKAATDAAKDMIGALTRQYNRARQETITKELLEIVGGAEALKG